MATKNLFALSRRGGRIRVFKHLPGQHDQKTHGRKKASGKSSETLPEGVVFFGEEPVSYSYRRHEGQWSEGDGIRNGVARKYTVDGHQVVIRHFDSSAEITEIHIALIREVPDKVWELSRNPLITFTDGRYMTGLRSPSNIITDSYADGLYWSGDEVGDSMGWSVSEGGSNKIWLNDTIVPRLQHNLMHELAHSVWFHDINSDRPLRNKLSNNLVNILHTNPPPEGPLDSTNDLWAYPRNVNALRGPEMFADMVAYMGSESTDKNMWDDSVRSVSGEDTSFESINMYDWINNHYGGEVPKHEVILFDVVVKFFGTCGVPEMYSMMEGEIAKHLPGQHDQKTHGNRNSSKGFDSVSNWGENDWWKDGPGERGDWMKDGNTRRLGLRTKSAHKIKFPGLCYQQCGTAILDFEAGDGVLVHGVIRKLGQGEVAHSWIRLPDGYIFEPTTDSVYHPKDFVDIFDPLTIIEYRDQSDVMLLMQKTEHFGPWDQASEMWYYAYSERGMANHETGSSAATNIIIDRGYLGNEFDDPYSPGSFLGDHYEWQDEIELLIQDADEDL